MALVDILLVPKAANEVNNFSPKGLHDDTKTSFEYVFHAFFILPPAVLNPELFRNFTLLFVDFVTWFNFPIFENQSRKLTKPLQYDTNRK